jgi:hypothetical protein
VTPTTAAAVSVNVRSVARSSHCQSYIASAPVAVATTIENAETIASPSVANGSRRSATANGSAANGSIGNRYRGGPWPPKGDAWLRLEL